MRAGRPRRLLGALTVSGFVVGSVLLAGCGRGATPEKVSVAVPAPAPATARCTPSPGEYSKGYLATVYRLVFPLFETAGQGIGEGAQSVDLDLLTGQEELAALVEDHFGDAVQLTVAGVPYCHGPGKAAACPTLTSGSPLPPGLRLSLTLKSPAINPTEGLGGTLTVNWAGPGTFRMDIGQPLVADTVKPRTRKVEGTFTGSIAGTGELIDLTPGRSQRVAVLVGTSRCGGTEGSALSPGHYDVRVVLGSEDSRDTRRYLSPPAKLLVLGLPS